MMFLSKEAANKDQCLKMQMILYLYKTDLSNSEKSSKKTRFFWWSKKWFYNNKTKLSREYLGLL